ncbi:MAG: hypothetical protein Q8P59_02685 [Dehalococcoidia bacterium]|nr:hypothetical protein [Dehalococcoidia bacterium]
MLWLKACPKCRGDVYPEKDIFETNLKCLQCGYVLNEAERQRIEPLGTSVRKAAPASGNPTTDKRAA